MCPVDQGAHLHLGQSYGLQWVYTKGFLLLCLYKLLRFVDIKIASQVPENLISHPGLEFSDVICTADPLYARS